MNKTKYLALNSLVAGIYAAVSLALPVLSYGTLVQFRFSEALIPAVAVIPEMAPGLILGCFISNLLSALWGINPLGFADSLVGTAATALSVVLTVMLAKKIGKSKLGFAVLPLPNIVINSVMIGLETVLILGGGVRGFLFFVLSVAIGETAVCYILGNLLISVFRQIFKSR